MTPLVLLGRAGEGAEEEFEEGIDVGTAVLCSCFVAMGSCSLYMLRFARSSVTVEVSFAFHGDS